MNKIVGTAGAILAAMAFVLLVHFVIGPPSFPWPILLFALIVALVVAATQVVGLGSRHPIPVGFLVGAVIGLATATSLPPSEIGIIMTIVGSIGASAGFGYFLLSSLY